MSVLRGLRSLLSVPVKIVLGMTGRAKGLIDQPRMLERKLDALIRGVEKQSDLFGALIERSDRQHTLLGAIESSANQIASSASQIESSVGQQLVLSGRLIEGSSNQQSLLNDKFVAVISRLDDQCRLLEAAIMRLDEHARLLDKISATHQGAVRRGIDLLDDRLEALRAGLLDRQASDMAAPHARTRDPGSETAAAAAERLWPDRLAAAGEPRPAAAHAGDQLPRDRVAAALRDGRDRLLNDWPWRGRSLQVCHQAHEQDRIYAENLAEYFGQIGAACHTLEFAAPGDVPELRQCLDDHTVAILGINSQLDHCWIGTESFVDAAARRNLPVIHWILDHPSSRWMEFNNATAPNARFLLASGYCERYFRRHARPGACTAATSGVGPNRRSRVRTWSRQTYLRREISCLIPLNLKRLGGSRDELETRIERLDPEIAAAVRAAIESARLDVTGPLEDHLERSLAQGGRELPLETFHSCARIVEDITQIERRLKIFQTASRFAVRIQTDAPPSWLTEGAAATFHTDPASTSNIATMGVMPSCRALLSVALTNDMLHDRVANALNAGCVAIVEDNAIHRRLFEHHKNALLFRYDDDSLSECLNLVCNDPERVCDVAQAGLAMRDDPAIRFANFHHILDLARH